MMPIKANMPSPRCCLNGPGYSVPPNDIKDVVGAPPISEPEHGLIPCRVRTHIDYFCGSQLSQPRDLAWTVLMCIRDKVRPGSVYLPCRFTKL